MPSISIRNKFVTPILCLSLVAILSACAPAVLVGGAGIGAAAVTDRRDTATLLEDAGIELRATDSIYTDNELSKKVQVKVHCYNGVVLLVGTVPNDAMRKKVEDMVFTIKPVRKVYNELRIGERQDLDARSTDSWISAKVKKQLIEEFGLVTHTLVATSHEVVYLMGLVNAEEERKALHAAARLRDVKDVVPLYERYDIEESNQARFAKPVPVKHVDEQVPAPGQFSNQDRMEDQDSQALPFELAPAADIPTE